MLKCQDKQLHGLAQGLQAASDFRSSSVLTASGISQKRSVRNGSKGWFCYRDASPAATLGLAPLDLQWQRLQQLCKKPSDSVRFCMSWPSASAVVFTRQGIKTAFEEVVFKILDTPSLLQSTQPLGTRQVDAQSQRQLATQFSIRLGRRRKKDVPADVFHWKVQAAEQSKHTNSIPDDLLRPEQWGSAAV
ncbi:hypothetical protein AK812_SmicGene30750 [Symbiodinium microadriaticum]|uniref:Uncharacterized protein n=1 Tax=Symbiodinium microadriaticum TaxID=2951 RepID=A0A1Q9CYG1_SYMMI|nr:hypothetical protein AK812_SmicGene30750 [Symbiodinium microadriaticum]CAE7282223.1 unnamed protein product [Symbiodinium microadriaticum]CAE7947229.1 unnamed protein product [Symbiodinium sp. KB8]